MKRRYDSDRIARADRQETDSRKKVKFTGMDEEDYLSSEHPEFRGEEAGDQNRHAANVPKTSEYAFFKKLKEERHWKSHLLSIPEGDVHAERSRLTSRLPWYEDSSAAALLKDVIPAKSPTVSGNPDHPETLYKPGEIFSRMRNNLLSLVTRSSLPEIGKLHLKGSELASVLLCRLTPKGADTLPHIGSLKSQLLPHVDAKESDQKNWESMNTEEAKYLIDSAFSSGKKPTAVTAASERITCQGEADCMTGNLDAKYDISSNLEMIEEEFMPFHGWNYKDASWSLGRAELKGDLSMSFADWVLEEGENRRSSPDAYEDLVRLPRLPSWTLDHHRRRGNLTQGGNLFALSVQSAASPRQYPSANREGFTQDRDYMASLPLLPDGVPSHPSLMWNYSFLAEDCRLRDGILEESYHREHCLPYPRPVVENFLISSGFDLTSLSPVGFSRQGGTFARSPCHVPLASIQDGGCETLAGDPTGHFIESPFCLSFERSSLCFLSISDGEEPWPGLPDILDSGGRA